METTKSPQAADSRLHFLDYWRIIRLRKVVIITVFLLVVITTTAVTFVLQPTFASTALIKVEHDTPDIALNGGPQGQSTFDYYFLQTEFETLKSERILNPVIKDLELDKRYAEHFKSEQVYNLQQAYLSLSPDIDVKNARNTSLIEITAQSWDKKLAADVANQIANEYKNYRDETRNSRYTGGLTTLTNQLDAFKSQVDALSLEVDRLKIDLKVPDIVAEGGQFYSLNTEEMRRLQSYKTDLQMQLAREDSEMRGLTNKAPEDIRNILNFSHPTPLLQSLLADFTRAEQQQVTLRHDYGPEHPDVKRINDLRAKLNSQLDDAVRGIMDGLLASVTSARANLKDVQAKLDKAKDDDDQNLARWRPYMDKKRTLEDRRKTFAQLQAFLTQQTIDSVISRQSSVTILNSARPGLQPVKPNKVINISLGAVFGLLLGVGLAFFIEYLDTSVKTIDDVEQALQAPVLGVIPQNVGSMLAEGPESPHSEAYRVLRTNILFSRKDPNLRAITVVSGGAGEGKSTTIFNLAVIFAQQGSRVLLVDSDLRRPTLHKLFNVSNSHGLTSYLLKQMKLEESIQTTAVPNLHFLPSGKLPGSSMGILNSAAMRAFIEEAKSRYDFVFFDSPPIMGVSDASILASEVDMAVLVVQYRKYPQQMTLRAKQMVEKVGGRMLGVVLNNINISQDSYYYYYSGYYYDYYSKSEESKPEAEKSSGGKGDMGLKGKF